MKHLIFLSAFLVLVSCSSGKLETYQNDDDTSRPFAGYLFHYPDNWSLSKESKNEYSESLELTRDAYRLSFFRADHGGAYCFFSDSIATAEVAPGLPFVGDYTNASFETLHAGIGELRRIILDGTPQNLLGLVCIKDGDKWLAGAGAFGGINYSLPLQYDEAYDEAIVAEMDGIVKSIHPSDKADQAVQ